MSNGLELATYDEQAERQRHVWPWGLESDLELGQAR